jgi:Spy/CpxP family protein refolding chaperone
MSTNLLAPARLERVWNSKLAGAIVLALVFLSGAAVGALAMDFGVHNRQRPPVFGTLQGRAASFERLRKELSLTDAQAEQVETTLDDFWQYYRSVLSDCKQRIEQILTPQQKVLFERLLQESNK